MNGLVVIWLFCFGLDVDALLTMTAPEDVEMHAINVLGVGNGQGCEECPDAEYYFMETWRKLSHFCIDKLLNCQK